MNCAQVKEQLVDFLYEELTPALQAAFVEHLRGCPACSALVTSHQQALGQTRAALAGPLSQEPPARVHAAVLAAAREAAATRAAGSARERSKAGKNKEPGFLARFWRTPWLLPAFGAVSVATAVFLVKVLKNPEVLPRQKPAPVEELVAPAPGAAPASSEPTLAAPPGARPVPASAAGAEAKKMEHKRARGGLGRAATFGEKAKAPAAKARKAEASLPAGKGSAAGGAPSHFAEPPPPRPASRPSRDIDDLLGPVGSRPAPTPAEREAAKPSVGKKAAASRDEDTPLLDRAPAPGTPRAQEPSAPAGAPPLAPAPAVTATPPSPSRALRAKSAEAAAKQTPMESAVESESETQARRADRAKDKAGPSVAEASARADRLFAAQDWNAAAAAYRDLVRRFPSHQDAPKWRERISQSLVAEQARRRANEAKASKAAE